MADRSQTAEGGTQSGQPTPEELKEIMAGLDFFLEMDEATALEAEDEVSEEATEGSKGGGDGGK